MLLFLKITLAVFLAELGDKTQLMLIAMAAKYKLRDIITGTAAAILVLNAIAVLAGGLVGSLIPEWLIKLAAALAFLFFSITSILSKEEDEEESGHTTLSFAPAAVFATFFLAELGDKTQLAAIAFGASEGLSRALVVWAGCSVGLFAADILGLLVGYLLKSSIPDKGLDYISFLLFAVFGVLTLREGLSLYFGAGSAIVLTGVVIALVLLIMALIVNIKRR